MAYEWADIVGRLTEGVSTFSANSLNPIFDALAERTEYLKDALNHLSGSYGLIYTDTGFSPEVVASGHGTILAWDSGRGLYIPAKAAFSGEVRGDGSYAPAESAYVVGVLISSVSSDGYGTILVNGWTADAALIGELTSDGTVGPYYLGENGKAVVGTAEQFDVPVYCFSYLGSGKLVFNPKPPEYSGHSHNNHKLPYSGWEELPDSSMAPEELIGSDSDSSSSSTPSVVSVYDSANDPALAELLSRAPTRCILTKNGTVVSDSDWCITYPDNSDSSSSSSADSAKIYVAFKVYSNDEIVLYTISALQGKDPLVHSLKIAYGNKLLKLNGTSGNLTLDTDFAPTGNDVYTGKAIASIGNDGAKQCPVVHSIYAGPGMSLSPAKDENGQNVNGSFVLSTNAILKNQADLQVGNLDGALFGTDSGRLSYIFPASVTSSLYGTFRIPHFEQGSFSAKINVLARGTGGTIPSSTATITPIAFPGDDSSDSGSTAVPSSFDVTISGASGTVVERYYKLTGTVSQGFVSSDAVMNVKLTFTNPAAAVNVAAISLELKAE